VFEACTCGRCYINVTIEFHFIAIGFTWTVGFAGVDMHVRYRDSSCEDRVSFGPGILGRCNDCTEKMACRFIGNKSEDGVCNS
jgi:hypothetical protein